MNASQTNEALRGAFSQTLLALAKENKDIVALTSDATGSMMLGDFAAQLPGQFVEVGIAEQNSVGVAAGMALDGKRPFVCGPAPFLSARALEQVKVDVAYNAANVKLIGVSGGVSYGSLGYSHHALHDLAVMRALVGLCVLLPCDAAQMRVLTRLLAQTDKPAYCRLGRRALPFVYAENAPLQIGRANTLKAGDDAALLAAGEMLYPALQAAELLEKEGIHARVLDMFSIKPIDEEAIEKAARETGHIVTVEEHSIYGGLGGAVAELVATKYPAKMKIMGLPDESIITGESAQVLPYYQLDGPGIAQAAKTLLK